MKNWLNCIYNKELINEGNVYLNEIKCILLIIF